MNTTQLKSKLHFLIDSIEDKMLLNTVYAALSRWLPAGKGDEIWNELSKEQQEEIEKAIFELDAGQGISHTDMMAKMK
jgi:hypothetical protein